MALRAGYWRRAFWRVQSDGNHDVDWGSAAKWATHGNNQNGVESRNYDVVKRLNGQLGYANACGRVVLIILCALRRRLPTLPQAKAWGSIAAPGRAHDQLCADWARIGHGRTFAFGRLGIKALTWGSEPYSSCNVTFVLQRSPATVWLALRQTSSTLDIEVVLFLSPSRPSSD